jgi:hypothetical protein
LQKEAGWQDIPVIVITARDLNAKMLPDNVNVQLILDRTAERERDRRRQQAQLKHKAARAFPPQS